MTRIALISLMTWLVGGFSSPSQTPLFPKHIEPPEYPPIARTAHLMGKVRLTVSIDEHGNVQNAEAANDSPAQPAPLILQRYAIENVRRWTFEKPTSASYSAAIVYDFEFDPSLDAKGRPTKSQGHCHTPSTSKVIFDLPERVTILTNLEVLNTQSEPTTH
jgi:TonB family protein